MSPDLDVGETDMLRKRQTEQENGRLPDAEKAPRQPVEPGLRQHPNAPSRGDRR